MIDDSEIPRQHRVFQDGTRWNVDLVPLVSHDHHASFQRDIHSKAHIATEIFFGGVYSISEIKERAEEAKG